MIVLLILFSTILILGVLALAAQGILQAAAGWEFDRELGRTSDILHQAVLRQADLALAPAGE